MTTTKDDVDLHPCLCGCGELVTGKWKRGHWQKAQRQKAGLPELRPLPGPDEDLPDEDLPDELVAELDELDWLDAQEPIRADLPDELPPMDPPPGKIPPPRGGRAGGQPKRQRVTVTLQRDVQAKIRMVLMPAGQMWAIRDGMCGGTFVQQEPAISEALAEIVCDSPDLLNWFTGPAGGYMKYFKLLMAVQPVAVMLWMHHVAHADGVVQVDGQAPQQMANYAA